MRGFQAHNPRRRSGVLQNVRAKAAWAASLTVATAATIAAGLAPAASAGHTPHAGGPLAGHGELAYVAHGKLFLTGGPAGARRAVTLPGQPLSPAWSAGHSTLAVLSQRVQSGGPGGPSLGPGSLWIVSASGAGAHRITPPSWDVTSFAWSRSGSELAVAVSLPHTKPAQAGLVAAGGPGRSWHTLATASFISGVGWSPAGSVAAGVNGFAGGTWHGRIDVLDPAGKAPVTVVDSPQNVLEFAAWWPDGSGLTYWLDPGGSSSIAADGLPLHSLLLAPGAARAARSGHRVLPTMLTHRALLAFTPAGRRIAITAGGGRVIWSGHKRITECPRTGACSALPQPAGVVSLAPSWSPTGRALVFFRASASGPFGPRGHAGFSPYWIRRWEATARMWFSEAGRTGPVESAGAGALDPVWGSDGSILYIRADAVWLLPAGGSRPVQLTGTLGALTGAQASLAYYGYVPYPALTAWTLAPTGNG